MKPIIKSICDDISGSVFQTSLKISELEKAVLNFFEKKEFANILSSNIQLYITLFVSTTNQSVEKNIHVEVSEELEGDHDIYALQCTITNLKLVDGISSCRILIGTKEYCINNKKETSDTDTNKFVAVEPKWDMQNVILPEVVRKRLMRAISIIEYKDIIYNILEFSKIDKSTKSIICFYGPAGTGKTISAQAIAKYLGKKIMVSSYAQIESKYVGDGAKNLRAIFQAAEEQDAVLFMDEADSFLSKRIESTQSSSDKHYNRMSNELFQLLEEFNGCVIFATNLMTDVDKAFKSRIIDSIMIPLPDVEGRIKILSKMIPERFLIQIFKNNELKDFAEELKGFSGRDIRKSILLSYADIAPKISELGIENYSWDKNVFRQGFDHVKETIEVVEDIPLEDIQEFTEELKNRRKQFELAKHAVSVDGTVIDDREKGVIHELSKILLNKPFDGSDFTPKMTLIEICENASKDFKDLLIDTAIRVITIDGDFSENEKEFLAKLCTLLNFSKEKTNVLFDYSASMANSYKLWINACCEANIS